MQYFFIVVHSIVGDDLTIDKVFLNPKQAITWGRRKATKNPEFSYKLMRQPITSAGTVTYYKTLEPFACEPFDWGDFENQGSDWDIDLKR